MAIVYLHQYFNTPQMSGGTRSYEMARRLVTKGHKVHMVTSWRQDDGRKGWFETKEAGIHVHWLPVPYSNKMNFRQRIEAFSRFALLSASKASSLNGDVIFATSTPLTIALPAIYASRRKRVPMVFEVRDLWPKTPMAVGALKNPGLKISAKLLEHVAYRSAEAVVALSPGMRDGVVETGYDAQRVAVIPNSSDNDFFRQAGKKEAAAFRGARPWLGNRPLLVYAGAFGLINGVGYLVDMANRMKTIAPEVRVLLVGDGRELEEVRNRAESAGVLGVNLYMENLTPKNDMPALFAAADMTTSTVIDVPELFPNSANKFFDSLAASRPILLNYGGWQADLVTAADCGIVTWKQPIDEAADLVTRRLRDRAWLEAAGKSAHVLARELFDRDVLADKLEQVLVASVGRNGTRAAAIADGNFELSLSSLL